MFTRANRCGTPLVHLKFQTEVDFPETLTKVDLDKRAYGRVMGVRLQGLPDLGTIEFRVDLRCSTCVNPPLQRRPRGTCPYLSSCGRTLQYLIEVSLVQLH
jgi:hypothetical protein